MSFAVYRPWGSQFQYPSLSCHCCQMRVFSSAFTNVFVDIVSYILLRCQQLYRSNSRIARTSGWTLQYAVASSSPGLTLNVSWLQPAHLFIQRIPTIQRCEVHQSSAQSGPFNRPSAKSSNAPRSLVRLLEDLALVVWSTLSPTRKEAMLSIHFSHHIAQLHMHLQH